MQKLTKPQKALLVDMYLEGPTKLHHVHQLGYRLPVMRALVKLGLAEHGKIFHSGLWQGRLTTTGRVRARLP